LFGARLSLSSAEHFWEARLLANALTEQAWVDRPPKSLGTFAAQVAAFVRRHQARKCPYSLLGPGLEESAWLKTYSPRHKRRLYSAVFGVSRQALDRIHGLQSFLAQACGLDDSPPRLLEHINADVYYDQPHFNRTFRKLTGLTPVAYFAAPSRLQDNLMAASYNAQALEPAML
jgi:AraC-like DNA-binding protein